MKRPNRQPDVTSQLQRPHSPQARQTVINWPVEAARATNARWTALDSLERAFRSCARFRGLGARPSRRCRNYAMRRRRNTASPHRAKERQVAAGKVYGRGKKPIASRKLREHAPRVRTDEKVAVAVGKKARTLAKAAAWRWELFGAGYLTRQARRKLGNIAHSRPAATRPAPASGQFLLTPPPAVVG